MKQGYIVEYDSEDQICIIPNLSISLETAIALIKMYSALGYLYWLPADQRRGFIFSKKRQGA
jgi:hypothetical protein